MTLHPALSPGPHVKFCVPYKVSFWVMWMITRVRVLMQLLIWTSIIVVGISPQTWMTRMTLYNSYKLYCAIHNWDNKISRHTCSFFHILHCGKLYHSSSLTLLRTTMVGMRGGRPWKILRAMDLARDGLSYTGIDILRGCLTGGVKYFRGSILPCTADLQWVAKSVEAYAQSLIPFMLG